MQSVQKQHQVNLLLMVFICLGLLFTSCKTDTPSITPTPARPIPDQISSSPSASQTPLPPPTAIQPPFSAWINPFFPADIYNLISQNPSLMMVTDESDALVKFSTEGDNQVGSWVYLAVTPFYSFLEDIKSVELITYWKTGAMNSLNFDKLYLTEETINALTLLWGPPHEGTYIISNKSSLVSSLWPEPNSIAIIPFNEVKMSWKVLTVDGDNPLKHDFDPTKYPLIVPITMTSPSLPGTDILGGIPYNNFDETKLTSIALTGVTALVRDTAAIMEEKGILYPAGDIQEILSSADITHISNEVPFAVNCPSPDPNQESLYFCSKDSYIQLLEAVGTDIVELSGDHFGDWGPEAMLHSLDLYHARNWLTYGGGETLQDGLDPVFIENNGNRFAFIGCNGKIHDAYATASDTNPGASRCNFEWMTEEIKRLHQEGYIVIATMQHEEVDSFFPIAIQLQDFRRLADAGATIVSGSQAHHPQGFEYTGTSFIHYGLGNLFFDQWYLAHYNPSVHANKDKAFIDLHYFYKGTHINTQLISLQFIDNARPRLMTPDEAQPFLMEIYKVSLWDNQPIFPYSQ